MVEREGDGAGRLEEDRKHEGRDILEGEEDFGEGRVIGGNGRGRVEDWKKELVIGLGEGKKRKKVRGKRWMVGGRK